MQKYHFNKIVPFLVLTASVFFQILYFQWSYFDSILISSLWENPVEFLRFYLPKIAISILIGAVAFLFRSKKAAVIGCMSVSVAIDMWILSELVYLRANHVPLDTYTIAMVDNMDGFWGSIILYFNNSDIWLFVISFVLGLILLLCYKDSCYKHRVHHLFFMFVLGLTLSFLSCVLNWSVYNIKQRVEVEKDLKQRNDEVLPPGAEGGKLHFFCSPLSFEMESFVYAGSDIYMYDYSVAHALFYCIKGFFWHKKDINTLKTLSTDIFDPTSNNQFKPNSRLVICLVESLESWVLQPDIMPNLYSLIDNDNVLFADKVVSQARRGTSADGQMIVETGLLPIKGGAVCRLYNQNIFPSLSWLYGESQSAGLFPHKLDVWNQKEMSEAYGFGQSYTCSEDDIILLSKAQEVASEKKCLLFITMSTHSPFSEFSEKSMLDTPKDMPLFMRNYIKSFNYFDSCLQSFIDWMKTDAIASSTTFVITGDHTVFQDEKRQEFSHYSKNNPSIQYDVEGGGNCPLIIISPKIVKNIQIKDICYQMDIYPTLLSVLGCAGYCWKGFGKDLSNPTSIRHFTEEQAFDISDKIIRLDYFKDYESLVHCNQSYKK